ncbi:winged helix-turn-helix transcriptional regulator [Spirosoma aerolatum]|uniref:winged helix-turn-helix transcriptional regulator n=1 Tax=Spirosoma aerolatum TaxID=1211326 RepID=UPI0009ABF298|nr:helix-turn-helix domain-containing protein [Spirosoma aerolatum]
MRKATSTNTQNAKQLTANCPILSTFHLLGGRWKIALIWNIAQDINRFSLLRNQLPGLSQKMLGQQLKELEQDGFIGKTIFAEVPPRTEYYLAELGQSLLPLLAQVYDWGLAHNLTQRVQERYEAEAASQSAR